MANNTIITVTPDDDIITLHKKLRILHGDEAARNIVQKLFIYQTLIDEFTDDITPEIVDAVQLGYINDPYCSDICDYLYRIVDHCYGMEISLIDFLEQGGLL